LRREDFCPRKPAVTAAARRKDVPIVDATASPCAGGFLKGTGFPRHPGGETPCWWNRNGPCARAGRQAIYSALSLLRWVRRRWCDRGAAGEGLWQTRGAGALCMARFLNFSCRRPRRLCLPPARLPWWTAAERLREIRTLLKRPRSQRQTLRWVELTLAARLRPKFLPATN